MSEEKRYGDPVFGNTLADLKALTPLTQTINGLRFEWPAQKVGAVLTLAAVAGDLIAEIERLNGTIEDLELALQDAEESAESAGRNASAFEDRMGDLQVENGKLRDSIAARSNKLNEAQGIIDQLRGDALVAVEVEQRFTKATLAEIGPNAYERLLTGETHCTNLIARTYTTRAGESVMGIANRELGSSDRWKEIHDLNADRFPGIGPHDYYPISTVLKMPEHNRNL